MTVPEPARRWYRPEDHMPPESTPILAMDSGGHVQTLIYESSLWWVEDQSMYVYYTPRFWQPLPETR